MITHFGLIFFMISTLILFATSLAGLYRQRLWSVIFLGLTGYSAILLFNSSELIFEFGAETYDGASTIYLYGSIALAISVLGWDTLINGSKRIPTTWSKEELEQHSRLCLVFALLSLLLLRADLPDLGINWAEARLESGRLTVLAAFFFILASPGITSAFYTRRYLLGFLLLGICGLLVVLMGSRAALLGALMLGFWLLVRSEISVTRRLQIAIFFVAVGFALHTLLRELRGLGLEGLLQAYQEGTLTAALSGNGAPVDVSGGELAISKYFIYATTIAGDPTFGFMTSISRMVLIFIPRIGGIFDDKPVDVVYLFWQRAYEDGLFVNQEGQDLLRELYLNGPSGSLHGTLFGEYYLTGGITSLILSCFLLGLGVSCIDKLMSKLDNFSSLFLCGPVLIGFVFAARGNSVTGFGYFAYLLVIILAIQFLLRRLDFLPYIRPYVKR